MEKKFIKVVATTNRKDEEMTFEIVNVGGKDIICSLRFGQTEVINGRADVASKFAFQEFSQRIQLLVSKLEKEVTGNVPS